MYCLPRGVRTAFCTSADGKQKRKPNKEKINRNLRIRINLRLKF